MCGIVEEGLVCALVLRPTSVSTKGTWIKFVVVVLTFLLERYGLIVALSTSRFDIDAKLEDMKG